MYTSTCTYTHTLSHTRACQGMSAANKEMKTMMKKNKELDIDYIDKMQDDMFDMMVGECRHRREEEGRKITHAVKYHCPH